jgi:hypothetical protein
MATWSIWAWFPSRNKALAGLRRLAQGRQIQLAGTLGRRGGRPEHVYCRWRPRRASFGTRWSRPTLRLRLDAQEVRRGPPSWTCCVLPDAEVLIGGVAFYLEVDRGTMSHRRSRPPLPALRGLPSLLAVGLFVRREEGWAACPRRRPPDHGAIRRL